MVTRYTNPLGEMLSLREAMNQLLEGSFIRPGVTLMNAGGATAYSFPLNVYKSGEDLKVEALLPGVSEEDLQVSIDQGALTIEARRHGWEPQEGQSWFVREVHPGQFTRTLSLPFPVEANNVTADFANGVLTLTLPKAEAARPKRIQIGGQQQQQVTAKATKVNS